LAKVDSLMDARPDSALYILDTLEASSHGFPKSTLRRWQLLRLMAQNKCDTIFRSDSLHLVLTDYFDRNGTPNERMTAYYLLGRAYVDMGDAPLALKCYLKATECADTTSDQCDWRQLTIIHMQTGLLFYKQYMPNEALESFAEAIWSAVSPTVNYRYFT
jgi:tetratricopeptide (TPR) repeat protein